MLKFSVVLAFVAVFACALLANLFFVDARTPKHYELTSSYSYSQYLVDSGKKIPTDPLEFAKREKLFIESLKEVLTHNSKPGQLYKKGINRFSDWTKEEFKKINGGKSIEMQHVAKELQNKPYHSFHTAGSSTANFPKDFDYRNINNGKYLTAVKDQGNCGSCWAHGSTETLESHYAIATGELFVLSQQEVTSCAANPNECGGTGKCEGSIASLAYQYIIENGGQTQEWEYPYVSYFGTDVKCAIPSMATSKARFTGYKSVTPNSQTAVMDALLTAGPLAVNVDASNWNSYESGIYDGCNYAKNISIDHVVQLTGWGFDQALNSQYWVIRNSWSASFGEEGYIRLVKYDTPECGLNVNTADGVACVKPNGAPKTQYTCGQCGVLFDTTYPIAQLPPKNKKN